MSPKTVSTVAEKGTTTQKQMTLFSFLSPQPVKAALEVSSAALGTSPSTSTNGATPCSNASERGAEEDRCSCSASPSQAGDGAALVTVMRPTRRALQRSVDWGSVAGEIVSSWSADEESRTADDPCDLTTRPTEKTRSREGSSQECTSSDVSLGALLELDAYPEREEDQRDSVARCDANSTSRLSEGRARSVRSFHCADEDADEQSPLLRRLAQAFAHADDEPSEEARSSAQTSAQTPAPTHASPTSPCGTSNGRAVAQAKTTLSQTCLDFGQSSLTAGTTCARCGMFYATSQEDMAVHRAHCSAMLTRRTAAESGISEKAVRATARLTAVLEKKTALHHRADGPAHSSDALLMTSVGVDLLDLLTRDKAQRRRKRSRTDVAGTLAESSTAASLSPLCERVGGLSPSNVALYVLKCGHSEILTSPAALRLLEALGFLDLAEPALDYTVLFAVDTRVRRIVSAAAGRASLREQDPDLVLLHHAGGSTRCATQQRFSLCDLNYVWRAPTVQLARALLAHSRDTAAHTFGGSGDAIQRFFRATESRQEEQAAAHDEAMRVRAQCLGLALTALAQRVMYGQRLHLTEQCSYARDWLFDEADKRDNETRHMSRTDLKDVLASLVGADEALDWFEHNLIEDDEEGSDVYGGVESSV